MTLLGGGRGSIIKIYALIIINWCYELTIPVVSRIRSVPTCNVPLLCLAHSKFAPIKLWVIFIVSCEM